MIISITIVIILIYVFDLFIYDLILIVLLYLLSFTYLLIFSRMILVVRFIFVMLYNRRNRRLSGVHRCGGLVVRRVIEEFNSFFWLYIWGFKGFIIDNNFIQKEEIKI